MGSEPFKLHLRKKTLDSQQAFLGFFAEMGRVKWAAKAARITRKTHYHWLKNDSRYAVAFEQSKREAGDYFESIAIERATVGWLEPVRYQRKICGHVRRYSDVLLIFLLRGFMPEKYGLHRQRGSAPPLPHIQSNVSVVFVHPEDSDP